MKNAMALAAEFSICLGVALIRIGARKLLPVIAERLDAPEILEIPELVNAKEIGQLILEVAKDCSLQSKG